MKETKHRWKIFTKSKLIAADYKDDKEKVIAYYNNTLGYRDARILRDSVWRDHKGRSGFTWMSMKAGLLLPEYRLARQLHLR